MKKKKSQSEKLKMSIKIVMADDHKVVLDGLKSLIEKESDMEVVGEANDGRTTLNVVRKVIPDVVIMDISMPGLNGVEATQQITTETPEIKVIALSMHEEKRFVKGMLKAGASGYLLKECPFEEVVSAIRTVCAGRTYICSGITGVVIKDYVHQMSKTESILASLLTKREREVIQLLAEGKTTKEIASELYISVKTVATHRDRIMKKLGIHSIAGLTKFAVREGLSSLDG